MYRIPSVQETATYRPLGSKVTCLDPLVCLRRYLTFVMSSTLTILTVSSLHAVSSPVRVASSTERTLLAGHRNPLAVF